MSACVSTAHFVAQVERSGHAKTAAERDALQVRCADLELELVAARAAAASAISRAAIVMAREQRLAPPGVAAAPCGAGRCGESQLPPPPRGLQLSSGGVNGASEPSPGDALLSPGDALLRV